MTTELSQAVEYLAQAIPPGTWQMLRATYLEREDAAVLVSAARPDPEELDGFAAWARDAGIGSAWTVSTDGEGDWADYSDTAGLFGSFGETVDGPVILSGNKGVLAVS